MIVKTQCHVEETRCMLKKGGAEVTAAAVELRVLIKQMREQI
ncbi:hypothetical protein [Shewanella waksmanii]